MLNSKNNLIICDLPEHTGETQLILFDSIRSILLEKMGYALELNVVDYLKRLGEPKKDYNRNVLLCLSSGITKQAILGSRGKLKGTDIHINNDLDKETQLINSKHRQAFKKLRESGARVRVRNGSIWINDVEYSS